MDSLKKRLQAGETVFGLFYKTNSPIVTEMIAWAGFDFIVLDCEHSPIGYESCENIVRTAQGEGMNAIIRIPSAREEHIFHALDSGSNGVQIPNITNLEDLKQSLLNTKYFPLGHRGLSRAQRAAKFGFWKENENPYCDYANDNSLVVVHIENKEMADNIEEICQLPQIDVVFVGPADMSQSLGIPGKSTDPRVVEIAEKVIKTAVKYNKVAGIFVGNPKAAEQYMNAGARYILYGSDTSQFAKVLKETMTTINNLKK